MALATIMTFMFIASSVGSIVAGGMGAANKKCEYEAEAKNLSEKLKQQNSVLNSELSNIKQITQLTIDKITDIQMQTASDVFNFNLAQQRFANSHKLLEIIVSTCCLILLITLLIKYLYF